MSTKIPMNPFRAKLEGKKDKEQQDKETLILSNAYKHIFTDSPEGRLVFKDLMEFCRVFETTMTGNSFTYFEEGKRAAGLHILYMREFGMEQELKLMREETYKNQTNEKGE